MLASSHPAFQKGEELSHFSVCNIEKLGGTWGDEATKNI